MRMLLLFWTTLGATQISLQLEINITKFDNCFNDLTEKEKWPIEIQEVHYEFNEESYIHQISGTYLVRTIDGRKKELSITVYKCSSNEPPQCERKLEHIVTELHCDKFRNDDSGIWYMVSQAMSRSTCGNETGLFEFKIQRVKHDYFEKYLVEAEKSSRYRMRLLFHKISDEAKDQRACVEIHFTVHH